MNCGTGATSGTNGIGRMGRELWIGYKLQACASGGIVLDKGLKEKPVLESSISNKKKYL